MQNNNTISNRLINEKNPYLLQHANNPVDWFPWCKEAFDLAKELNKPIFLSIGYSTCHWCHVMAHESFENEEIATKMNDVFVNIKVDREERPDIDGIYMDVCQLLNGSGGWPLTIIMTPDKKPFFAGTYFPKETVYGRIGMNDLVDRIADLWQNKKNEVLESAESLTQRIQSIAFKSESGEINPESLHKGFNQLSLSYDEEYGGFGTSPKFPIPHNYRFLLKYSKLFDKELAIDIALNSLLKMGKAGIYDHLGYGFHRYSTDQQWLVPHFEKMLYDQANLISAYSEVYEQKNDAFFKNIIDETIQYVIREFRTDENAFYSAEDADSEGVEGKFYVWTSAEINEILKEDAPLFLDFFNIQEEGNYFEEHTQQKSGKNILHVTENSEKIVSKYNIQNDELVSKIEALKSKIFDVREKRIHPHKDRKVLTDWNALMISALVKASKSLNNNEYLQHAENTVKFIEDNMFDGEKLLHRYNDGEAGITANADDYAFLVRAYLDLYSITLNKEYLEKAVQLNEFFMKHFWDERNGGFFFTPDYGEDLITRKKEIYDGAIPSSNSVAFENLYDLFQYTGNVKFKSFMDKLAGIFAPQIQRHPTGYTHFLYAYAKSLTESVEIVLVHESNQDLSQWIEKIRNSKNNTYVLIKDKETENRLDIIADFTKEFNQVDSKITAYVCRNFTCSLPITDFAIFKQDLE